MRVEEEEGERKREERERLNRFQSKAFVFGVRFSFPPAVQRQGDTASALLTLRLGTVLKRGRVRRRGARRVRCFQRRGVVGMASVSFSFFLSLLSVSF